MKCKKGEGSQYLCLYLWRWNGDFMLQILRLFVAVLWFIGWGILYGKLMNFFGECLLKLEKSIYGMYQSRKKQD